MLIRQLDQCDLFTAGDGTLLRELLHPDKQPIDCRYSLAHAILPPRSSSTLHALATSEVYYIMDGHGTMEIDGERRDVGPGDCIVIPPKALQRLHNASDADIVFLCIVDPAWQKDDETVYP